VKAILYADGAARGNPGPAGAGAVLIDADGHVLAEPHQEPRARHQQRGRVHRADHRPRGGEARGVDDIDVRMDSKLVVEQMNGRWKIKHPNMKPLALRAGELWATFRRRSIAHVPREENGIADALSNKAIDDTLTTRAIDDAT